LWELTDPGRRLNIVRRSLAIGVALLAVAACSAGSGGKAHPTLSNSPLPDLAGKGVVSGQFIAVGGPPGAPNSPLRGRLVIRHHGHQVLMVPVPRSGKFSFSIAPGRYRVVGLSPQYRGNGKEAACPAFHPLKVGAGLTTHLNVYCERN
jgi:hypothetical protein